jgi:hypothetical protein
MLLSTEYRLPRAIRDVVSQLHDRFLQSMTDQQKSEKRTAPETSSGINSLIAAANSDDRFKLLEDDCVPAANLTNAIHPIFWWFDCDGPMKQMLQLASHFLAHDSVLVFFVPLLYGRLLMRNNGSTIKSYLSDPFVHCSDARPEEIIAGVRQALHCLAHTIEFRFMKPEKRVYARTLTKLTRSLLLYFSEDRLQSLRLQTDSRSSTTLMTGTGSALAAHSFAMTFSSHRRSFMRLCMLWALCDEVTSLNHASALAIPIQSGVMLGSSSCLAV